MYDENNIFAKIIRGEIPCKKVFEDETCLFFYDISPKVKIHVLGIPKTPSVDFSDFVSNNDSVVVLDFFKKIDLVLDMLKIKNSGYKLVSNSGIDGMQEVPHFHIHILGGERLKF